MNEHQHVGLHQLYQGLARAGDGQLRVLSGGAPRPVRAFHPDRFAAAVDRARDRIAFDGPVAAVGDLRAEDNQLVVKLSARTYAEFLASAALLAHSPTVQRTAATLLATGRYQDWLALGLVSAIKVNVTVVGADSRFLAIQRSTNVSDKRGQWTCGPNETMEPPTEVGAGDDDFFALARRALLEEVGLDACDYGEVYVTWCGLYAPTAQLKVFACVRTHLSEAEVNWQMTQAPSVDEAAQWAWLPFTVDVVSRAERGESLGARRTWSDSTPVALGESWRVRDVLGY